MIQAILPGLVNLAGSWLESRTEQTKAKGAVAKAKAEAESKAMLTAATHDSKWELMMAQSTQTSIKDEIVTIVILIPVILVFIPGMEDVVKAGFERLNELPEWYQGLVYITCLAALGLKGMDKWRKK